MLCDDVGWTSVQDPAGWIARGRRHRLACWKWLHQHGAGHQRAGAAEEDSRRVRQSVASRSRAGSQVCGVLLGLESVFSYLQTFPSQHRSFLVFEDF